MLHAWLRLIGSAIGVAFVAAAAQLGVAQATGIVNWSDVADPARWRMTLTWIAFAYLVAVLVGATIGRRALKKHSRADRVPARIVAALAAGIGSALAVGLAWLPAHGAQPPVNVHPELVVSMTAGVAIAAGVLLAVAALNVPPIAGGLRAFIAWTWLLAIGCVVAGVISSGPDPAPRLGVLDVPSLVPATWWSGPYLQVIAATVLGFAVALMARWGGAPRFAILISGLAGPACVAVAYLITELDAVPLIAAGAGLLASGLVALPKRPATAEPDDDAENAPDARPLGRRDQQSAQAEEQVWDDYPGGEPTRSDQGWTEQTWQEQPWSEPAWGEPEPARAGKARPEKPEKRSKARSGKARAEQAQPSDSDRSTPAWNEATAGQTAAQPTAPVPVAKASASVPAAPTRASNAAPTIGRPPRPAEQREQAAPPTDGAFEASRPAPQDWRSNSERRTPDEEYQAYHSWFSELGEGKADRG